MISSACDHTKDSVPILSNPNRESALVQHVPEWHKNANIYEVHLRHYSKEGTFEGFRKHLPRLKEMGIDILWLMPIHPVSRIKRKGSMGSPYAVADYYGINPDMGSMEEFRLLLKEIHESDMHCIIDWVPNHSGWDNKWIYEHPDWYSKNVQGEITDPLNAHTGESWGWTDVADLNYNVPAMRQGMIDAMAFWLREIGVDGFRVDVAHAVPSDFWQECTNQLFKIKPIFMLAEAEDPGLVNAGAFVMDYAWEMHHLCNDIASSRGAQEGEVAKLQQGNLVSSQVHDGPQRSAKDIDYVLQRTHARYKRGFKMYFTSNHDENAWAGTEFRRLGAGHKAFAVLAATLDGMPLIFSGQEAAMSKKLAFFEKDEIEWEDLVYHDFYKKLLTLKHKNQALWNGVYGGSISKIKSSNDDEVYAFSREKNGDRVTAVINLSSSTNELYLSLDGDDSYQEEFTKKERDPKREFLISLAPWDYRVFSNKY